MTKSIRHKYYEWKKNCYWPMCGSFGGKPVKSWTGVTCKACLKRKQKNKGKK